MLLLLNFPSQHGLFFPTFISARVKILKAHLLTCALNKSISHSFSFFSILPQTLFSTALGKNGSEGLLVKIDAE